MNEHLIRLRGGWLRVDPEGPPDAPESGEGVTLPFILPAAPTGRIRLSRSFGPPPFDPVSEALTLRFARVGGLASVRLNGREIARPPAGTDGIEIRLHGPLPRRNLLVLDVRSDTRLAPPMPGPSLEPWGEIALVIRPREPSTALGGDPGEEELLGGIEPGE